MINKADKDPISDLALKTRKFVALRDEIIREIGHYCAELSHELFIEYTTDLVPQLLELEWTDELYQDFLSHRRTIDRLGLNRAGELVLMNLRELFL